MSRPISDRMAATLRESHTVATEVLVLRSGLQIGALQPVDGSVSLSASSAIRGRIDMTFVGDIDDDPNLLYSLLRVDGTELFVRAGVSWPDGHELVDLGVYRIDDVQFEEQGATPVAQISGQDRSAKVADDRFTATTSIAAGTNYADAIRSVIVDVLPTVEFALASTTATTPLLVYQEEGDRWAAVSDMATSLGWVLYFDGLGRLIGAPEPDPTTVSSIWSFIDGADNTAVSRPRRKTRSGVFNGVIATGETTSGAAPVRGEAYDVDPVSPTYWYGPYGKVPRFYRSPLLTSNEQCADAATSLLRTSRRFVEQIDIAASPLPHLEPGDVIDASTGQGEASYVVTSHTIGIPNGGSRITAGAR